MSDPEPGVWLGDDGILRVRYPPNCHLTLEGVEKVHRRHLAITRTPCPLLVYAESVVSAEYDAQQFPSRDEVAAVVRAMGIIVKSAFTRAMAELFMRFHRPPYPTRVFRDEQAALEWLARYMGEDSAPRADG